MFSAKIWLAVVLKLQSDYLTHSCKSFVHRKP